VALENNKYTNWPIRYLLQ